MPPRIQRLLAPSPSPWAFALAGLAVALLCWRVGMNAPGAGLDASWNAGLAMGAHDSLQFGRELVFTYGPLGFLGSPYVWYSQQGVLAFLFSGAVYVGFCIALVAALGRALPLIVAAVLAFFLIGALPPLEQALLLAVIAGLALLERERSPRALNAFVVGAASFAAVEALVKLSTGPVIAAVFLLALIGARAGGWRIAAYLVLFAVEVLALWLVSGQSLAAIPDFIANTREIVSGYSSAMIREVDVAPWKVTVASMAAAVTTVALVAACAAGRFRDRRALIAAAALMALAGFSVFKEGVVRTDAGHLSLYFSTACVLWIAIPWTRARWPWLLAGAAAIALAGLPVRTAETPTNLDPVANVRNAGEQLRNLFSPGRRADLIAAGRAGMKATYRLDPRTRAALAGRTVAVEPWEAGAAWAYEMDWKPVPVFQNYSAYTAGLDRLNTEAVESSDGPERILRENPLLVFPEFPTQDLDSRFPGWDPPEQQRAVLCHFVPLHTTDRWQVLGRAPNRCGVPRPAGSVEAEAGEAVAVPAPGRGEAVFVRIHGAGVSGLERLGALLFHARVRRAVVNGDESFRLIPETAADGLLLRGNGPFAAPGPFSPFPQARTIAVSGAGDDLRFEFFRLQLRELHRNAPAGSLPS
ncbi:MAG TPA: hypothetical protein VFJ61_08230 [Solirubrobacterales bacterium]|nr:hypothetical protein [Solirubrobacterales bacterium]